MDSLNTLTMKSNKKIKINFNGGDLSSDAGLLLIKEFVSKTGFDQLIENIFKTKDSASFRRHSDADNLLQVIYQTIAAYFRDDRADDLRTDPVFSAVLQKDSLASQPTLSRFLQRMDEDTLRQMNQIIRLLRKRIHSKDPEFMSLDIDTTLFETYGCQEGADFNNHYREVGYHPLLCYDTITAELLKAELRSGAKYCSKDSGAFMAELLDELHEDFPTTQFYLRGDSGFAAPELYDALEERNCKYAIRLKYNTRLHELARETDEKLYTIAKRDSDPLRYMVVYGEFMYQAHKWSHPRRVAFKIEKPEGQFIHLYTFIVTTMKELSPQQILRYYCGRGRMENFIQECKSGFGFNAVSSAKMIVNANRLQIHCMAYNLFNWFRYLALPQKMRRQHIDTIRNTLLKIAARVVRSARYVTFKLCSSCPYKQEFHQTLNNIWNLPVRLE